VGFILGFCGAKIYIYTVWNKYLKRNARNTGNSTCKTPTVKEMYSVLLLLMFWTLELSWNSLVDAGCLCNKAAIFDVLIEVRPS
jgi:hypothetical protein